MFEIFINGLGIVLGSLIGYIFRRYSSDKMSDSIIKVIGLFIVIMGIKDGLTYTNGLEIAVFLVLGTVLGEISNLDDKLNNLGEILKNKFAPNSNDNNMVTGFITATLIFCVGSLAILGPIKIVLESNPDLIYIKTILDTIMSAILASTYGLGVIFSAPCLIIYQGFFFVIGKGLKILIEEPEILKTIGSIGGIILTGLGFNLVIGTKIKITNMLPGLFLPIIYYLIF